MMRFMCFVISMCALFCTGMGTRSGVSDEEYIKAGREFDSVVAIESPSADGRNTVRGSGVLLADSWVLTAGHVLNDMPRPTVRYRGKLHTSAGEFIHPDFSIDPNRYRGDIGLLKLATPILLKEFPHIGGTDEVGVACDIVGCGTHGVVGSSARNFDGQRRAGTQIIDQEIDLVLVTAMLPSGETERECVLTHGDSGGGLFSRGRLIGVHMQCEGPTADMGGYGDRNLHTAVNPYVGWIKETMTAHSESTPARITAENTAPVKPKKRFRPK